MSTIAKNEFEKSLARLEGLAKGQLFHTPSDSQPSEWAGSAPIDEDSMGDEIDENGTDYEGVKKSLAQKVAKSKALTPAEVAIVKGQSPLALIGEKISKGKKLTSAERWAIKGGRELFKSAKQDGVGEENKEARDVPDGNVADKDDGKINAEVGMSKGYGKAKHGKGMPGMPMAGQPMKMGMDGDEDEEHDEDEKAEKSLHGAARRQPNLSKGIEMSPILHEFVVAMGHALQGQETRVVKSIAKSLAPIFARIDAVEKSLADQGEFNKSLAEAVVGIGQHVAGGAEVATVAASGPVSAPRSQMRAAVTPIAKSFAGPGGLESGDSALAKSQIVDTMYEMVKSNKLNSLELVKFESTGQLSPNVQQAVLAFAQGGGR